MLDRRAFLVAGGSSLALLGLDAPLGAQGAVVTRRSIRGMSVNDPDLAAMRRAVAAMKRLPQSDCAQLDPLRRHPPQFLSARQLVLPAVAPRLHPRVRAHLPGIVGHVRLRAAVLELDRGPAIPGGVRRRRPRLQSAVSSAARRRQRPAARRRHGRSGGDVGHHDQSGFRSFRQHAAARPEQRRHVMAAAGRFRDGSGVQSAQRRAPGDRWQHVGGRAVGARSDLLPASCQRRPAVVRPEQAGNANSPDPMSRNFAFNGNFIDGAGSPWNVSVGDLGSPAALGYCYDDDTEPFAADLVMVTGDLMTKSCKPTGAWTLARRPVRA